MTVITPGAGCSITSTATVSTAGVTGCFIRRTAFFTGARLGLALATVRFAGAAFHALRSLAEVPLGSFPRFCTFDAFLRLATIDTPVLVCISRDVLVPDQKTAGQVPALHPTGY